MKYDLEYLENLLRIQSKTAEYINKIRWNFIKEYNVKFVLDFGCGCGYFRAYKPPEKDLIVDSYDINGHCPQTGIRKEKYDIICLWDVLEHLTEPLQIETRYIALSIPIKPLDISLKDWHHFKPWEHLVYFTNEQIDLIFDSLGFKLIKKGQPECPPRKDVWSIVYEKKNYIT